MFLLLLIISFLPIFILGTYIYKKDKDKEPKSLLFLLFMLGFLSAILVVFIDLVIIYLCPEIYLSGDYSSYNKVTLFITVFLEVALVEEFMKWIMIRTVGFNNKAFDELYDIIVYATFVALGFAFFENFFYVLDGGIKLGIYRAILSVPGHVSFGIFMGYYLGLAKIYKKKKISGKYYLNMILSILVPAIFHTIYNFCLMTDNFYYLLVFLGFIILIYFKATQKIKLFSETKKI